MDHAFSVYKRDLLVVILTFYVFRKYIVYLVSYFSTYAHNNLTLCIVNKFLKYFVYSHIF